MNTKEAFQKVKTLTGYDSKPMPSAITDPLSFAEDLNIFYARFDTTNCSEECKALLETLPIPEPAHLLHCEGGRTDSIPFFPKRHHPAHAILSEVLHGTSSITMDGSIKAAPLRHTPACSGFRQTCEVPVSLIYCSLQTDH
ncbi:hypothetical protein SKAU_G00231320 [Synaphobranchus kaupii]|uniref:Uncharacterized protein n=1 Tax=Synaphobranchus kaupii TaxID=118154 RepID=A0A9Q1ITD0_SYNKA|nr:hypothetical protein SKAU_G00231320 [Synaphobranchus kaupii]